MKKELKFCAYILVCIVIGFIDFFYELRGLYTLLFDIVIATIIIFKKRQEIGIRYNSNINNLYVFLILILSSTTINLLIFKDSVQTTNNNIDLYFIISIFLKSFTEEVIFRGYWLNYFLTNRNKTFAIIFVSFGFTVLHYFSGADILFVFIACIMLSMLYLKTKSIINTFMVHLLSNLYFILGLPYFITAYTNIEVKSGIKTVIIFILLIVVFIKFLLKKDDNKK